MPALCRDVADTLIELRDEKGGPLFPVGGTRVLAYPAAGLCGGRRQGRLWLLLHQHPDRRGSQRCEEERVGDAVLAKVQAHFASVFEKNHVGVTLQIDESPGQVYDAKHSNLHPLFNK